MTYTQEELTAIEQYAQIYMKISEMAVMLDKDEFELRDDIKTPDHPAHCAYIKGKLAQKLIVHRQMAELARVGSPLALQQSQQALTEMEDDE